MSAPWQTEMSERVPRIFCDACKKVAQAAKDKAPLAKEPLEQLCQLLGSQENTDQCKKALEGAIEAFEHKTAEQICTEVGFCRPDDFRNAFGLQ